MKIQWISKRNDITITITGRDTLDCIFKANTLLGTGWPTQFNKGKEVNT